MTERSLWVVDTDLLVSRLLVPRGVAARAVDHALARGILLVSEETLGELAEVLGRSRFDPYASREDRRQFVELLGGVARLVSVTRRLRACRDPRNDRFLDVALNGGAAAIVTGDHDLPDLDPFHGLRIVAPAVFLDWP
jgi:putative PIN family toxin of toxin-antitoxin system